MSNLLLEKAQNAAAKLLVEHPVLPRYKDHLSVLLIGSLASGYADDHSDIDLWVVCSDTVSERVSEQFAQNALRFDSMPPHTFTQDGTEVHHFTFPISKVRCALESHDDDMLFTIRHSVIYYDANAQFDALSALTADLPNAVIRDKVANAYSWVRIHAASMHELLRRYQPSTWLQCTSDLINAALKLACWLDAQAPAPPKWVFRQVQSCSTAPIILPAIQQLLRATGSVLDCDSLKSDRIQSVEEALISLDSTVRSALDSAGYRDIPTPTLRPI